MLVRLIECDGDCACYLGDLFCFRNVSNVIACYYKRKWCRNVTLLISVRYARKGAPSVIADAEKYLQDKSVDAICLTGIFIRLYV